MHRLAIFALLPLSLLVAPLQVGAEEGEHSVLEAAERGRQLFDEGHYAEAAEHLLKAYESNREPIFLQYVGRCKQELGLPCEAARYYRQYLEQGEPTTAVRTQLEDRLTQLDVQCEAATQAETGPTVEEGPQPRSDEPTGPPTVFGTEDEAEEGPSTRSTDITGGVLMGLGGLLVGISIPFWAIALGDYNEGNYEAFESHGWIGDGLGMAAGVPLIVVGLTVLLVGRARVWRHDLAESAAAGHGRAHPSLDWF